MTWPTVPISDFVIMNEEIKQHLNKPIFFSDCVVKQGIKCDGDGAAKI